MKTKTQKGITLIALIITIIVMLILVGVSVSLALNTGLFKTAQGAAKNTEAAKINETKLSSGKVTIKQEDGTEKEVDIDSFGGSGNKEDISTEGGPYIGCYAYVDGTIGIIYADLAHSVENGSWGGESYSYEAGTDFKDYYVSGTYDAGPFPANDILVAEGDGNERFLIMALEDIDGKRDGTDYTWYESKYEDGIDEVSTSTAFGTGKANTETMRGIWTDDADTAKSSGDIWGQIGENSNWFVPSRDEWLAFSDAFDIDSGNYFTTYGLSYYYWSSSQFGANGARYVDYSAGVMDDDDIDNSSFVRLSATF